MATSLVLGSDGKKRCAWCTGNDLYEQYHDREWGRPNKDERAIFEKLCLEGFQAGLSWLTILKKREAFREAFQGFEPLVVAKFGARDIRRLMNDEGIVRNRAKIESAINNARVLCAMHERGESLSTLVWQHTSKRSAQPRSISQLKAVTPESVALSKELKKRGFSFVGPTTMYAAMQSLGVVNDHIVGCHRAPTPK
jgi:DNA-3-methyladenine glycosylase I